jgi:HK97 family phage major capsid protein
MKELLRLKEEREAKNTEMRGLVEGDTLNKEQAERFDALEAEIKALDVEIEREQRVEAQRAKLAARKAPVVHKGNKGNDSLAGQMKNFNLLKAIGQVSEGKLDGLEAEVNAEGVKQNRGLSSGDGNSLNLPSVNRDLLADTATAGAENVGVDVNGIIPFLYSKNVLPKLGAQVWRGLSADYKIPLNDASGSVAWEGEGDTGAEVTPTFAASTLTPKRVGGYINVSKQLIRQANNSPDVNTFATRNLARLIDNAVETAALVGGGAGEPSGIVDTLTATVSNTAAPTRANVLALQTAISAANAEMGNIAYVTTPYIRSVLKTVDVGTDTGFFVWDGRYMSPGTNQVFGEGQVEGYRACATTIAGAGGASGANYMIFGNFEDLVIGQFGGMELIINPYTKAKEAKIEVIANTWVDVALLHNGSFAYNLHDLP